MDKLSFNIFPNVNFIDLCMYQFGHEQCERDTHLVLPQETTIYSTMYCPAPAL